MNRLPKFGGDDGRWVYDRIMVVECPNAIPPEKQDKQLLEYAEREGIVYKAVKTLPTVIANGYRFSLRWLCQLPLCRFPVQKFFRKPISFAK